MNQEDIFRPEGVDRPAEKSGGCGIRALLMILALTGGLSLLCCCGIGISMYSMVPKVQDDPAAAQQILAELLTLELPEGYTPKTSVIMNMFSFASIRGVIIPGPEEKGMIIVVGLGGSLGQQQEFIDKIEEAIKKETDDAEIIVQNSETREFDINGQPVEFVFLEGTRRTSAGSATESEPAPETEPADTETPASPSTEEIAEAPTETQPPVDPNLPAPSGDSAVDSEMAAAPEDAAEAESAKPAGEKVRQVRAMIPTADGPVMFLMIVDESHWNEAEAVKMIESIQIPAAKP